MRLATWDAGRRTHAILDSSSCLVVITRDIGGVTFSWTNAMKCLSQAESFSPKLISIELSLHHFSSIFSLYFSWHSSLSYQRPQKPKPNPSASEGLKSSPPRGTRSRTSSAASRSKGPKSTTHPNPTAGIPSWGRAAPYAVLRTWFTATPGWSTAPITHRRAAVWAKRRGCSAARPPWVVGPRLHRAGPCRGRPDHTVACSLRKLSGCYECHMIVDPTRYPSPRSRICACSECGEVFPKMESLELHQAVRHAVSELGPEDSGRNIVEIIFKSSWLKKDNPICKIERILKVHNTQRTIQRFEDCRDTVKLRATAHTKKNPRCAADGNELLRFHCTTLACSLGSRGSSSLCGPAPGCGVCTIIRHGFRGSASDGKGVRTMASSGRAHDCLAGSDGRRAMLVCRVIAGRVRRMADDSPPEEDSVSPGLYDSVAVFAGVYSNLEELSVFNPRAILPCFVVIYKALES
ncbi:C2H2-like zinc finger protein [Actinidia rufa]|uniref:C2H2-like zinc finger protein n=1 Tax=Actinidia rufa TaxID=165716 RepID=A0A7J0DIH8_9ERIC|nr:C2H2-like zinc finger protein [Actinidia rufa]